jgi:DnaJ family protein C protein 17
MAKDDLLAHAASDVDFYELLGVQFETSESDIRRAYRKTALKYHPDKLGKDFDPEKFHLLQIANDVLSDPAAKAAYDNARSARLQKKRQVELFEGKRRQMKEELEARERSGVATASGGVKRPREETEMEAEIRRLAEEGRRRREILEERRRVEAGRVSTKSEPAPAAQAGSAQTPPDSEQRQTAAEEAEEEDEVARLERRIREVQEAKAKRKADKKARKSGVFVPAQSDVESTPRSKSPTKQDHNAVATPKPRFDFENTKAGAASSSSTPKFSFTPRKATAADDEFAATYERLKEAERKRLADEIRRKDAEMTQ